MAFEEPTQDKNKLAPPAPSSQEVDLDTATDELAKRFGVPRSVWQRMVRQESGGDVNAVGPVTRGGGKATSAWQIMPRTAEGIRKPDGTVINPNDPLEAAYGGLKLLSDNYKKFRPHAQSETHAWMMAIAGYHGNPANVSKDLKNGGIGVPDQDDKYINTQDHVYKILHGVRETELDRAPKGFMVRHFNGRQPAAQNTAQRPASPVQNPAGGNTPNGAQPARRPPQGGYQITTQTGQRVTTPFDPNAPVPTLKDVATVRPRANRPAPRPSNNNPLPGAIIQGEPRPLNNNPPPGTITQGPPPAVPPVAPTPEEKQLETQLTSADRALIADLRRTSGYSAQLSDGQIWRDFNDRLERDIEGHNPAFFAETVQGERNEKIKRRNEVIKRRNEEIKRRNEVIKRRNEVIKRRNAVIKQRNEAVRSGRQVAVAIPANDLAYHLGLTPEQLAQYPVAAQQRAAAQIRELVAKDADTRRTQGADKVGVPSSSTQAERRYQLGLRRTPLAPDAALVALDDLGETRLPQVGQAAYDAATADLAASAAPATRRRQQLWALEKELRPEVARRMREQVSAVSAQAVGLGGIAPTLPGPTEAEIDAATQREAQGILANQPGSWGNPNIGRGESQLVQRGREVGAVARVLAKPGQNPNRVPGVAEHGVNAFVQGMGQILPDALKGLGVLSAMGQGGRADDQSLHIAGRALESALHAALPQNPQYANNIPTQIINGLGQVVTQVALGVATRGAANSAARVGLTAAQTAKVAKVAPLVVNGVLFSGQGLAQGYDDARAQGLDERAARRVGLLYAGAAATNIIPFERFMSRLNGTTQGRFWQTVRRQSRRGFFEEGSQEALEQALNDAALRAYGGNRNKTLTASMLDVLRGGFVGAIVGGVASGAGAAPGGLRQRKLTQQVVGAAQRAAGDARENINVTELPPELQRLHSTILEQAFNALEAERRGHHDEARALAVKVLTGRQQLTEWAQAQAQTPGPASESGVSNNNAGATQPVVGAAQTAAGGAQENSNVTELPPNATPPDSLETPNTTTTPDSLETPNAVPPAARPVVAENATTVPAPPVAKNLSSVTGAEAAKSIAARRQKPETGVFGIEPDAPAAPKPVVKEAAATVPAAKPTRPLQGKRMGDFIEFFGDDAEQVGKLFGVTVARGLRHPVPMAGVPAHAIERYIEEAKQQGVNIEVNDLETNAPAKPAASKTAPAVAPVFTEGDRFRLEAGGDVFEVQPRPKFIGKNFHKLKNLTTGETVERPFGARDLHRLIREPAPAAPLSAPVPAASPITATPTERGTSGAGKESALPDKGETKAAKTAKKAAVGKPTPARVSDKYYITRSVEDGQIYEEAADAKPVTVPGFEHLDLFLHRGNDARGLPAVAISEGRTGFRIADGLDIEMAVQKAADRLKVNPAKVEEVIQKQGLDKHGYSPRYNAAALPTAKPAATPAPAVKPDTAAISDAVDKAFDEVFGTAETKVTAPTKAVEEYVLGVTKSLPDTQFNKLYAVRKEFTDAGYTVEWHPKINAFAVKGGPPKDTIDAFINKILTRKTEHAAAPKAKDAVGNLVSKGLETDARRDAARRVVADIELPLAIQVNETYPQRVPVIKTANSAELQNALARVRALKPEYTGTAATVLGELETALTARVAFARDLDLADVAAGLDVLFMTRPTDFDQVKYAAAKSLFEKGLAHFENIEPYQAAVAMLTELRDKHNFPAEKAKKVLPYLKEYIRERIEGDKQNADTDELATNNQSGDAIERAADVPGTDRPKTVGRGSTSTSGSSVGDLRTTDGRRADRKPAKQKAALGKSAATNTGDAPSAGDSDSASDGVSEREQRLAGKTDYSAPVESLTREGSWQATARRNLDILELVKRLEAEGRLATPEEQALIAKFTGWGASEIANNLFPGTQYGDRTIKPEQARDTNWRTLAERAKELFTPEELKTALSSTQYAHYTSEKVIRSIWTALARMGFTGGTILEPGMGTGLFAVAGPSDVIAKSRYTGIERDHLTAAIAKQLLQRQAVLQADYTQAHLPDNFFDVAIGNPPFSDTRVLDDQRYKRHRFMLHDYFFAKTIDKVRPGGLLVFVTSKGTMDKKSQKMRQYVAERADLLGAIRLPQTAFKANAGTEVVTDVLFLRKRLPGEAAGGESWMGGSEVTGLDKWKETKTGEVNEYFAAHPEMVLGEHAFTGSMYRQNEYTVTPREGDIEEHFLEAVKRLPTAVYADTARGEQTKAAVREKDWNPTAQKEGQLYIHADGTLMRREHGAGVALATAEPGLNSKQVAWLRDYVPLRDALKQAQYDQLHDGNWEKSLQAVNKVYDAFVLKHGPIGKYTTTVRTKIDEDGEEIASESRRYTNKRLLLQDIESALVVALERETDDGELVKAPVLLKRTVNQPREPEIRTLSDALAVSLDKLGTLNLAHVAELIAPVQEMTEAQVISELGDAVFETPGGTYQLADEYLSGYVKDKLAEAEFAARTDPRWERNVKALTDVQPIPLPSAQITAVLGAAWIKPQYINDFARQELELRTTVTFDPPSNLWQVSGAFGPGSQSRRSVAETWGIEKRSPFEILEAALNGKAFRIMDKDEKGKTFLDTTATDAANDLTKKMRQAFKSWIFRDAARANDITDEYNERFNNIVPRHFDGKHLTLPGLSSIYKLHPHQSRAVWRILQTGNTYLAHAVGAGKTLEMIVAGMEQKRLGLINKPMYVVPNHMLRQFGSEFLEAYPLANILVADEENFKPEKRQKFVAQAALNDLDAIVITHDAFGMLRTKQETTDVVVKEMVRQLQAAMSELDENDRTDQRTIKQLEGHIETMERRFSGKRNAESGDNVVDFEDLGVDFLFVDEAHKFRKLDFVTNHTQIKGVTPDGSRRSLDLLIKMRWLNQQRPGRSAVLASGTPITNTLAELYSIQRYLDPQELADSELEHFDAWANQFGEVVGNYEMDAAGKYALVERFSRFVNLPDLMKRVRKFMDVLTLNQLSSLVKVPTIRGGSPQVVVIPATEGQTAYLKGELTRRIETSKKWKPSFDQPNNPDPMINIITDGRLSAIDERFINPSAPSDPGSKLNRMLDSIIEKHKEYGGLEYTHKDTKAVDPQKGAAQIIFSMVGFGAQVAATRGFDVRGWILQRFKAAGIPAREVAFMSDYDTPTKKEAMFKEMRQGTKRILIGSPSNMGTGLNIQKRLKVLHFLSPPWFPADVEQPDGRIIRQGNQNDEIEIYRYATKGTYDSTAWQMVARKSKSIEQAMSGDDSQRSLEDISESSQYEMASALAAGDVRAIQVAGLGGEIERLSRLQASHAETQTALRGNVGKLERNIAADKKDLEELQAALKQVGYRIRPEDFRVTVDNTTYEKRAEMGAALLAKWKDFIAAETKNIESGSETAGGDYKKPVLGTSNNDTEVFLRTYVSWAVVEGKRKITWSPALPMLRAGDVTVALYDGTFTLAQVDEIEPGGLATRVYNALNSFGEKVRETERSIREAEQKLRQTKAKIGQPFAEEQELYEKIAEQAQLLAEMASSVGDDATEGMAIAAESLARDGAIDLAEPESTPSENADSENLQRMSAPDHARITALRVTKSAASFAPAKFTRRGDVIIADNAEAAEILRRLLAPKGKLAEQPDLHAALLNPPQVRRFLARLAGLAIDLEAANGDPALIARITALEEEARASARDVKGGAGTLTLQVGDNAEVLAESLAHERVHKGNLMASGYQAFAERLNGEVPAASGAHSAYQKVTKHLQIHGEVGKTLSASDKMRILDETAAYAAGGYALVGMDKAEAVDFLRTFADDWVDFYGKEALPEWKDQLPHTDELFKELKAKYGKQQTSAEVQPSGLSAPNGDGLGREPGTGTAVARASDSGSNQARSSGDAPGALKSDTEPDVRESPAGISPESETVKAEAKATGETPDEIAAHNRRFADTLRETGRVSADIEYLPGTNRQQILDAQALIAEHGLDEAIGIFNKMQTSDGGKMVALGTFLIDHLGSTGRIEAMIDVHKRLVERVGEAAQVLQATRIAAIHSPADSLAFWGTVTMKARGKGNPVTTAEAEKIMAVAAQAKGAAELEALNRELERQVITAKEEADEKVAELENQLAALADALKTEQAKPKRTGQDLELRRQLENAQAALRRAKAAAEKAEKNPIIRQPRLAQTESELRARLESQEGNLLARLRDKFSNVARMSVGKRVAADAQPHELTRKQFAAKAELSKKRESFRSQTMLAVQMPNKHPLMPAETIVREEAGFYNYKNTRRNENHPFNLTVSRDEQGRTRYLATYSGYDDTVAAGAAFDEENNLVGIRTEENGIGLASALLDAAYKDLGLFGVKGPSSQQGFNFVHKWFIRRALREGLSVPPRVLAEYEGLTARHSDVADESPQRMSAPAPLDADTERDLVDLATLRLIQGKDKAQTPAQWEAAMIAIVGEGIRPYLPKLRAEALAVIKQSQAKPKPASENTKAWREQIKAAREYARDAADDASQAVRDMFGLKTGKNKKPTRLAEALIKTAQARNDSSAVLELAHLLTTTKDLDAIRAVMPQLIGKDFDKAFVAAMKLITAAKEQVRTDLRAARQARRKFTDEQMAAFEAEKKQAALASLQALRAQRALFLQLTRNKWQKAADFAYDIAFGFFRAMQASSDASYFGRQGVAGLIMHPLETAKTYWPSVKTVAGEQQFANARQWIMNQPDYNATVQMGVEYAVAHNDPQRAGEETLSSWLAEKVNPLVAPSSRLYNTSHDLQAYRLGSLYKKQLDGLTLPKEDYEKAARALGTWVNRVTGKGDILRLMRNNESVFGRTMGAVLYAGRFTLSRFQVGYTMTPLGWARLPKGARAIIGRDILKLYGALAAVSLPMVLAFGTGFIDPEDEDFLTFKIGDETYDPTGSMREPLRLIFGMGKMAGYAMKRDKDGMARLASALSGKYRDGRFVRSKLSPTASLAVDAATGKDFLGQPFNWYQGITSRTIPLTGQALRDALLYDRTEAATTPDTQGSGEAFEQTKKRFSEIKQRAGRNAGSATRIGVLNALGVGTAKYPRMESSTALREAYYLRGPMPENDKFAKDGKPYTKKVDATPAERLKTLLEYWQGHGNPVTVEELTKIRKYAIGAEVSVIDSALAKARAAEANRAKKKAAPANTKKPNY